MKSSLRFCIFACDTIWIAVALVLSYGLCYGHFEASPTPINAFLLLVGAGVWGLLFTTMSLDCIESGWRFHVTVGKMLHATSVLVTVMLASAYLAKLYYLRLILEYFCVLLPGFLLIRVGWYLFRRSLHRTGHGKRVVLMGSERFAREFAFKINRHPELLYQIVGTLYPVVGPGSDASNGLTLGDSNYNPGHLGSVDVLKCFAERRVNELIVLQEGPPGLEFHTFIAQCQTMGMCVTVLPSGYELYTSKPKLIEIDGLPLISLETPSGLPGQHQSSGAWTL